VTERDIETWNDWKWQLRNQINSIEELGNYVTVSPEEERSIFRTEEKNKFQWGVSPYYASLMDRDDPDCPIRLQAIPRGGEWISYPGEVDDPLAEEKHMPVKGVTHRYPDRALWYLSHSCAVYCRFCTRKRKVSQPFETPNRSEWESALDYFRSQPVLREVILSGGDPLSLGDNWIDFILTELKKIPHINQVRIHTRHFVTLPMRITDSLCRILSKHFPIYIVTHFNHPKECTPQAREAVRKAVQIGNVNMSNQTVLLKSVNDSVDTLRELSYNLLSMGVKPYYLHQCDEIFGISHFRVPLERGLKIYQGLRGHISGIGVPVYVADLTGGGGKVPIVPEYLVEKKDGTVVFRNYKGDLYEISNE
jgi:lysine 2,3-aminomutase